MVLWLPEFPPPYKSIPASALPPRAPPSVSNLLSVIVIPEALSDHKQDIPDPVVVDQVVTNLFFSIVTLSA